MKRYLRLYWHFWRNSWLAFLEFRFNCLVWSLMNLLSLVLVLFLTELIFGQVEAIAGWSKNEVLILVCVQFLFLDVLWTLFLLNFTFFHDLVRKGDLDFALLKPVNLRFWISFRHLEFDHYLRILALLFLLRRYLTFLNIYPPFIAWLSFAVLFFLGVFIFYNLFFILITTNFWFINLFNLEELFGEIVGVSRAPVDVFRGFFRFVFVFIVPVAFITTFPVQFLLGRGSIFLMLFGVVLAVLTFLFSHWFWRFALKHYSSASS